MGVVFPLLHNRRYSALEVAEAQVDNWQPWRDGP